MNRSRVAALFAALAEEFASPDEHDDRGDDREASPAPKSQPKITDLDRAKARKHLRKLGVPLR